MAEYCKLQGNCLVVYVPKELDHHIAKHLRVEADQMAEIHRVKKMVFDFAQTEFMDSSGIGVMIGRSRKMAFYGGKVAARNLNPRMEKLFQVSGLHKIISVEE